MQAFQPQHHVSVIAPEGAPELWSRRLDVDAVRATSPKVTVPRPGDGIVTALGRLVDAAITAPLSGVVLSSSIPTILQGLRDTDALAERWGFYADPKWRSDPASFFTRPDAVEPETRQVHGVAWRPRRGTVRDLVFRSEFTPVNPAMRDDYLRFEQNREAHARIWRHADGPRPTVVCVHGYMASNPHINQELFNLRWLYERGMDVVLYELPFHGSRASGMPGYAFPNFDLPRLAEGFAHAVHDFRALFDWLLAEGAREVGVMGVSLGGYTAALLAGLEERLAFSVPIIPATSVVDAAADWGAAGTALRLFMQRLGATMDDLREVAAVHTPLQHAPVIDRDRLLVVGADGDRVTPPYQTQLLEQHWDGPETLWFAGSHVMQVHRGTYLRRLGRFLGRLGMFTHAV